MRVWGAGADSWLVWPTRWQWAWYAGLLLHGIIGIVALLVPAPRVQRCGILMVVLSLASVALVVAKIEHFRGYVDATHLAARWAPPFLAGALIAYKSR